MGRGSVAAVMWEKRQTAGSSGDSQDDTPGPDQRSREKAVRVDGTGPEETGKPPLRWWRGNTGQTRMNRGPDTWLRGLVRISVDTGPAAGHGLGLTGGLQEQVAEGGGQPEAALGLEHLSGHGLQLAGNAGLTGAQGAIERLGSL